MDFFRRKKNKLPQPPTVSSSYFDSMATHQAGAPFLVCACLLIIKYLQTPHFMKWCLLAHGSFGQG